MDASRTVNRRLWLRWALLLAGWIVWVAAMRGPIPSSAKGLISIYPETLDMHLNGQIWRSPALLQIVLPLFVIASTVWGLSPLLMALIHRFSLRSIRWVGWLLVGVLPAVAFLAVRNGSSLAFYLLGGSHLLACMAIVPWPGEPNQTPHGFEVLPAAKLRDEP